METNALYDLLQVGQNDNKFSIYDTIFLMKIDECRE